MTKFLHIIDGKPSLAPAGAWALVLSSGLLEDYEINDQVDEGGRPTACTVTVKRRGLSKPYSVTYTLDDARAAGLTEGSLKANGEIRKAGNWEKYTANMLRWRALGYVCDVMFADVLGDLKRADEMLEVRTYGGNEMAIDPETGEVVLGLNDV